MGLAKIQLVYHAIIKRLSKLDFVVILLVS